MKNRTINWGIMGLGKIAVKFADDLKAVEGGRLYAAGSRSKDKADAFARAFNAEKSYGSYEELARDPEVDIIYIATPHVLHFENTLLCLRQGKAVLCEKPIAMNRSQAGIMAETAREKKLFLMEGLWTRFLPHFQYVMEIVRSGKMGKLKELHADFGFAAAFLPEKRLYNKALGGGSLLDIGIYPVFAAYSLMGKPDKISADAVFCSTGVDESCSVTFSYKDGRKAILESSINRTTPTTARLIFEEGEILINGRFHEPSSLLIQHQGKSENLDFTSKTFGYNYEAAHVQQMLQQNKTESELMPLSASLDIIGLLDEIRTKIGLEY